MAQTINIQTQSVSDFVSHINFKEPSWDLLLVAFFLVAAVLYGMSLGRDRLLVIMVSAYMSLAIIQAVPDVVLSINTDKVFAFRITTFIGVFLILFFMMSRSALLRTLGANASYGKMWQVLLFSLLHIGLLISIVMTYLPQEILSNFSPNMQQLFTNEWGQFFWIGSPVIAMLLVKPKEE